MQKKRIKMSFDKSFSTIYISDFINVFLGPN